MQSRYDQTPRSAERHFGDVTIDTESMELILCLLGRDDIRAIPYKKAPCWIRVSRPGQFEDNRYGPFNLWGWDNTSLDFIGTMYVLQDETLFLHPNGSNRVTREDDPELQQYFGDWFAPRLVENIDLQGTTDLVMNVVNGGQ